jgi:peptidoglycan hydrolase CwlO-like protein
MDRLYSDKSNIEDTISSDQRAYDYNREDAQKHVNSFNADRRTTETERAEMRRTVAELNAALINLRNKIAKEKQDLAKKEEVYNTKRQEVEAAKDIGRSIAKQIDQLKRRKEFWNSLASLAFETKTTDAEGRFSFAVTNKSVFIVAYATRKIIDDEEEYFWIVPMGTNLSQPLLLNNANKID